MPIEVCPADQRFRTQADGRETWHSFSFGAHYDAHNLAFGALVAHNDERLPAGTGYADHPHRDTEIVTWVLSGALHHRDDQGHESVLEAGSVQVLSAGSGVVHREDTVGGTRFVQAWVRPDETGLPPAYAAARIDPGPGLRCVAGGSGEGGLPLRARAASCFAAELAAGEDLELPDAPRLHVFVVAGSALVGERRLAGGDAARLVREGGRRLSADGPTTALVWALA